MVGGLDSQESFLGVYGTSGGFPGGSAGKESPFNAGDLDSIPGLGRSPGERTGYPLQYSGLENSMVLSMELQKVRHEGFPGGSDSK